MVVIGGGIAGCTAALAAAGAGAEVTLLSRAPGATALYAGGMEIAPPGPVLPPREPFHPFVRLEVTEGEVAQTLDEACDRLGSALDAAGHPLRGDWRTARTYLDVLGRERPAQLVPATVAGGEIERLRSNRVAVVDVAGVGEYDADVIRCAIGDGASRVDVDLGLTPGASLTDLFGRQAPRLDVDADIALFPPGFTDLPEGAVELLAAVPSPHGLRLHRALERVLSAAGVDVRHHQAATYARSGDRLTEVDGVAGDEFVLATGRYIGGGLVKNGVVREPVFDLGVFHEGERVDRAHPARLRHLEYVSPEPAFRTGVLADPGLRPLDWEGRVRFENLRAAGSVLGGYDYGREYGFGVPILTGWLAGAWAAR